MALAHYFSSSELVLGHACACVMPRNNNNIIIALYPHRSWTCYLYIQKYVQCSGKLGSDSWLTNYLIARLNSSSSCCNRSNYYIASTSMHVSVAVHVSSIMIKYVHYYHIIIILCILACKSLVLPSMAHAVARIPSVVHTCEESDHSWLYP